MSRRSRTIMGATVVAAALLYLLGTGLGNNLVYFLTPTELLAKGPEAYGAPLRLSGEVEPGSIRRDDATGALSFRVRDDSTVVPVQSTSIPPEMFHEGMNVVLEGSLASTGVFHASTLMVKHANTYGPADSADMQAARLRAASASSDPGGTP